MKRVQYKPIFIIATVILVVAILSSLFFLFRENDEFSAEREIVLTAGDISNLLELYLGKHGKYPDSLYDLDIETLPSGVSTSFLNHFSYSSISEERDGTLSLSYKLERTKFPANVKIPKALESESQQ